MKKLVLEGTTADKLSRLSKKVAMLHYVGIDPKRLIEGPIVAIVGTRKLSPYGQQVTEMLSSGLARAGVTIISGNALGVDVFAQKCALEAGGKVIAVVPSGLDNVYPATNRRVADAIVSSGGAILSEYEAGHKPMRHEFLDRNRIIAALSDAVIIPEAAEQSGSLNTASHALKMQIPVYAVPGPITSQLSGGTNALLKNEARVITEVEDILHILNISHQNSQQSLLGSNEQETAILSAISNGVHDVALLGIQLQLATSELQNSLTMLEIDGRVYQNSIGAWHIR